MGYHEKTMGGVMAIRDALAAAGMDGVGTKDLLTVIGTPATGIAKRDSVLRRSLLRLLKTMREMGAEISYSRASNTYVLVNPDFIINTSTAHNKTCIHALLGSMIPVVGEIGVFPAGAKEAIERSFSFLPGSPGMTRTITTGITAWLQRRVLCLVADGKDGSTRTVLAEPHGLSLLYDSGWKVLLHTRTEGTCGPVVLNDVREAFALSKQFEFDQEVVAESLRIYKDYMRRKGTPVN